MKTISFLKNLIFTIIFLAISLTNYLKAQDFYAVDPNFYNLSADCSRNVNCLKGKEYSSASQRDYALFQQHCTDFAPDLHFYPDSGYEGLVKLFPNAFTPYKKNRKNPN
jgi:hypothetical protein